MRSCSITIRRNPDGPSGFKFRVRARVNGKIAPTADLRDYYTNDKADAKDMKNFMWGLCRTKAFGK